MEIFTKKYNDLHTYAGNLLYRAPWLIAKGCTAKDIVHEAYLAFHSYQDKFKDYDPGKLEQVLKNLVFWAFTKMKKVNIEFDDTIFDTIGDAPVAESRIFNKELESAIRDLDKNEANLVNLKLAGYSYQEINKIHGITNSESLVSNSINKMIVKLDIPSNELELNKKLINYVRKNTSIRVIEKETGISGYYITMKLKNILGPRYKEYTSNTQKTSQKKNKGR